MWDDERKRLTECQIPHLHHHLVDQMDVSVGALNVRSDNPARYSVIIDEAHGFLRKDINENV